MKLKWLAYFQNVQKEQALHYDSLKACVDYGEIVYRSSEFLDRRWLVAKWDATEEYNVFVEYTDAPNRFERLLAATFNSRDRAVGFAAEMFLICCGRLRRGNRRDWVGTTTSSRPIE